MRQELGFGCVRLTSNYSRKQAIRNLEIAYDNGITHFDVARLYGFGLAEGILGDFAKNKRDKITITSKFGISQNNALLKNLFLQNVIRSAYKFGKSTFLKRKAANLASGSMTPKDFSIQNAKQSLQISLQELKTDYIDYCLLHEAIVDEANNTELIDYLEDLKQNKVIREFGIASYSDTIEHNIGSLKPGYKVLQTNNSFPYQMPGTLLSLPSINTKFYFSPFLHLERVRELLNEDDVLNKAISDLLDFNVRDNCVRLFLMHQFYSDPSGTTLFTSNKNEKIIQAAHVWENIKSSGEKQFQQFDLVQQMITSKLMQHTSI